MKSKRVSAGRWRALEQGKLASEESISSSMPVILPASSGWEAWILG